MRMEKSSSNKEEKEEEEEEEEEVSKPFGKLVSKVLKDMSSLECRLVERIKAMERTILSNLSSSNPNIADSNKLQNNESNYVTAKELENNYKVLESLIKETLLQARNHQEDEEEEEEEEEEGEKDKVATGVQTKMAGIAVKLEQLFGLVRVLNCEEPKGSKESKTSFVTGRGDIFGQTPLALAIPGISQSTASLLGKSFGFGRPSYHSQNDLGVEKFNEEMGKFFRFIQGSDTLDLERYVIARNKTPKQSEEFQAGSENLPHLPYSSYSPPSPPTPPEVTLDTLVPCPRAKDVEKFYGNRGDLQEEVMPLEETSFPLRPTSQDSIQESTGRIDPDFYRIRSIASDRSDATDDFTAPHHNHDYHPHHHHHHHSHPHPNHHHHHHHHHHRRLHKRTRSFNAWIQANSTTGNRQTGRPHAATPTDRPTSTVFESIVPFQLETFPTGNDGTESLKGNDQGTDRTDLQWNRETTYETTHAVPQKTFNFNFRRAKSEASFKTRNSEKTKRPRTPANGDDFGDGEGRNGDGAPSDSWKSKSLKTVRMVDPTKQEGVLLNFASKEGHLEENSGFHEDDLYLSPADLEPSVRIDRDGEGSKANVGDQSASSGLEWPTNHVSGLVTYRKNAAKLRSRWDGFRRAFSMAFEKNGNNQSSNNNNNNNNSNHINCVVRKASSTNFIDGGSPAMLLDEKRTTRSNWEVWKRQSRANLTESFRRKCSWLRMTFKKKGRKGHPNVINASQSPEGTSNLKMDVDNGQTVEAEGAQIIIKSTLASVTDELLKTESDYVHAMGYVIEQYLPLLNSGQLPESLRGKKYVIFGNLEKIHDFHSKRFQESLLMCRGHPYALGSAFLRHEAEFDLYSLYSKNKPKSDSVMNDYGRKFFQIKQAELMDPMDLESYLLKPIQRLSKYALMLKKILHTCPMDTVEYTELEAALEMIRFQLRHGEDLLAADCITGCDVSLQDQGMLIRREDLMVTRGLRRSSRHVFLFEDLLLFSKTKKKPGAQDIYVYKHSIKTSDIGLTESMGDDGRQFEIWFRKRTPENSYRIQAESREAKEKWTSDISGLLWGQTERCRQRANVNVVMATGLGGNAIVQTSYDTSRPVSYVSSSSSSSSSNNSMDQRSSNYARNTASSSSSSSPSSSSTQVQRSSIESTNHNSSHTRPLSFIQTSPISQSEVTSSVIRPLTFAVRAGSKSCLAPVFSASLTTHGYPKLSPVKEQVT